MIEPTQQDTGHPGVDEVLRALDGLDDQPLSEHVAAFEAAHAALRGALADATAAPASGAAPTTGPSAGPSTA